MTKVTALVKILYKESQQEEKIAFMALLGCTVLCKSLLRETHGKSALMVWTPHI